jgi:hypothetical protein
MNTLLISGGLVDGLGVATRNINFVDVSGVNVRDLTINVCDIDTLDVSHMTTLRLLDLEYCLFVTPPDVTSNGNLRRLYINRNELTSPPDVSQNPLLLELYLIGNELLTAPDTTSNPLLEELVFYSNDEITASPDLSGNGNLLMYDASLCATPTFPDFTVTPLILHVNVAGQAVPVNVTEIDRVPMELDAHNTSNGFLRMTSIDANHPAPSATSLAARTAMASRNWQLFFNP